MKMPIPKIYGTTTMNEKGQVVVPADARKDLGLESGMRFVILDAPMGGGVLIIRTETIESHIKDLTSLLLTDK